MKRASAAAIASLAAVVAAGAAYEAAVALGLIGLGPRPAQPPTGNTPVLEASLLALMLLGLALVAATVARPAGRAWGVVAGAVASAFLVARFYSYDPYYAPDLVRISQNGVVAGTWVVVVIAVTLGAGLLAARWPRAGLAASGLGVWTIAMTAAVAGTGH
jgi:hypothetical protein